MKSRYQWTSHQNYKYSHSLADVMSVAAKRQAGQKVKFGFPMQVTVYTKKILKKMINALILYNKTFMQIFFIIFFSTEGYL